MLNQLLLTQIVRTLAQEDRPMTKLRSRILTIALNPVLTKLNITNFIKQSKLARRSKKSDFTEKAVLQYQLTGKCLRLRRQQLNTTFLIRNIISLTSFEMNFPLFSPLISQYIVHTPRKRCFKHANQYFLRRHAPVKSKITFDYVIN